MPNLRPLTRQNQLLNISENDPFLIQETIGLGNLFVFAVNLFPEWSEFPTSISFLPLLHRIVEHSLSETKSGIIELVMGENHADKLASANFSGDILQAV